MTPSSSPSNSRRPFAATLFSGFGQGAARKIENDLSDVTARIASLCGDIKSGNLDARMTNIEPGPLAEMQAQINELIDAVSARVSETETRYGAVIDKITTVCHEVRKGNFEARITHVEETGALAEVQDRVNDMVDCCDAFVRESTASLDAVCRNVYYRNILPGGLQGSFRVAADMINDSIATQAKAVEQARAEAAAQQAVIVNTLAAGLRSLAEGNLTHRIGDFPADYIQVRDDFNGAIGQLQETVEAITAATREVTNATAEVSISTTDLSQRTEEQAASLEETSAAMEQIASTVRKNAESAQRANKSAIDTSNVATRGSEIAAQAVGAMSQIEESSRNIAEIIGVIDEIARQTNLLALNAAVEAARAGDAGRGFAVVASEVRNLAQRSSQAAKDIKNLITSSSGQVKEGVGLVNQAGAALNDITESIKQMTDLVADIASASAEQATGIDEVNKALTQMDEMTQQNSALVEENAATARTLEEQVKAVDERISIFRVQDAAAAKTASVTDLSEAKQKPGAAPRRPAAAAGGRTRPVGQSQAALAADWQDF